MKVLRLFYLMLLTTALVACSSSQDPENTEHFASSQQRALEKAKNVENVLREADEKKRQELENLQR